MIIPDSLFELALWDSLPVTERQHAADIVASQLPAPWKLLGLETHSLGEASHELAFFDCEGAKFALVPGSKSATLGYDRKRNWRPSEEYLSDLEEFEKGYYPLRSYLNWTNSRLRTREILPLLVEVTYQEFEQGIEGTEELERLAERFPYQKRMERHIAPFRLVSSDEWEYVCAAGTRTLFRWGDELPPASCTWPGAEKSWTLHRQPNAFGLLMISDTYKYEQCRGGRIRGGDGGCTVCGSYSDVTNWLPLASSALLPKSEHEDWDDEGLMRRVWPLGK